MAASNPLDVTVTYLLDRTTDDDKAAFAAESADHLGVCFGFLGGMGMRNDLGLWRNDTPLTKWFSSHGVFHGDDRSSVIFKAMWCRLNGKTLDIAAEAEHYRAYWADKSCKPDGSPL